MTKCRLPSYNGNANEELSFDAWLHLHNCTCIMIIDAGMYGNRKLYIADHKEQKIIYTFGYDSSSNGISTSFDEEFTEILTFDEYKERFPLAENPFEEKEFATVVAHRGTFLPKYIFKTNSLSVYEHSMKVNAARSDKIVNYDNYFHYKTLASDWKDKLLDLYRNDTDDLTADELLADVLVINIR